MKLLILAACLAVCSAHMCLVSPRQRGTMSGLDKDGADDCILLTAPCGGRTAMVPETTWQAGGKYTVIFQKNLDHWAKSTPGYFELSMIANGQSQTLQRVPDNGEPSLYLYTASGMLPDDMDAMTYQLQIQYVTKNSQAPPVFYQCADVRVE